MDNTKLGSEIVNRIANEHDLSSGFDLVELEDQEVTGAIPEPSLKLPVPIRLGTFSGRYEGTRTKPLPSSVTQFLELRIDIDRRHPNSPVMNRVSGDFYDLKLWGFPGQPIRKTRTYRESWIVDNPQVVRATGALTISGSVRFWKGTHPKTRVTIRIPYLPLFGKRNAEVTFQVVGLALPQSIYSCSRISDSFRDLQLEVDVCNSVNTAPLLPSYDTGLHNNRPSGLPRRTLTIPEAYREAGIKVTLNPTHSNIDDSASGFTSWSPAELHDAMETHYSSISGAWPNWRMWGLLGGTFDSSGVGGIMFDAGTMYGGAGKAPERQGFALFRKHSWFNNLVTNPVTQNEAWAMRHYLYTWIHEAGHAFNLLHSWNKSRPDALSWMNYDWKYDARNGTDSFWGAFEFRFDDEELIHIRHGDRASVIMGGDPWASGGHMEHETEAFADVDGDIPLEFLIRSKEFFDFMEPVKVEFRLRNLLDNMPIDIDSRFDPEYGGMAVFVRRPDGRTLRYEPLLCKKGTPEIKTLKASPSNALALGEPQTGDDRHSDEVLLSYGAYGFYFDEPGEYLIRAIYQGTGDIIIPSNVHRIRIARPISKEEDRLAQDLFSYEVGMSIYLHGSRSPFLKKGMEILEEVAAKHSKTPLGNKAATTLADSYSRSFFRNITGVMKQTEKPDVKKALSLTEPALSVFREETSKSSNIAFNKLVQLRTSCHLAAGQKEVAKGEIIELRTKLSKRGVNSRVIENLKKQEERL